MLFSLGILRLNFIIYSININGWEMMIAFGFMAAAR